MISLLGSAQCHITVPIYVVERSFLHSYNLEGSKGRAFSRDLRDRFHKYCIGMKLVHTAQSVLETLAQSRNNKCILNRKPQNLKLDKSNRIPTAANVFES